MELKTKRATAVTLAVAAWLSAVPFLRGQTAARTLPNTVPGQTQPPTPTAANKPLISDQFFKNVQVLKGIPVDQFLGTMGFIAASLSVNCTECHVAGANGMITDYALDTPKKQKARQMMIMVKNLNQASFGGGHRVTCYTCHRSDTSPRETPSLAEQNGSPPERDPNDIEVLDEPIPGASTAEQILSKYLEALGGTERLAAIKNFSARGTYSGFDTNLETVPLEVYAKAPGASTTIVHRSDKAENITTCDGHYAWVVMTNTVLPLKQLTGGELDAAQFDAKMFFPGGIRDYLHDWRTGFPQTTVDEHLANVIQGTAPGGTRVKLFFDSKSGLLIRVVRFANTALGLNPSQVDYSNYRDLNGIKFPFHWTLTWTDGRSDFDMTDVQPNAPVDSAKFGEAALPKSAAQ